MPYFLNSKPGFVHYSHVLMGFCDFCPSVFSSTWGFVVHTVG